VLIARFVLISRAPSGMMVSNEFLVVGERQ
jgi:hypothetical protein